MHTKEELKHFKINCTPQREPLSYPSCVDYSKWGMIAPEFAKSGWVETRRQWRIINNNKE